MEFLTVKEQKILKTLKEINNKVIDFNVYRKTGIADMLGIKSNNLYYYIKKLEQKGYIKYENNCITYN